MRRSKHDGVNYADEDVGESGRVRSLSLRSCGKNLVLEETTSYNKYSRV